MQKKAIILLSGGLDSITVLALAKKQGFKCYALSFDYGQRHNAELIAAAQIAADYQVEDHKIIKLGLSSIGGSALTDKNIAVPNEPQKGIPVTYVPARNTIFLSFALGWAEVLKSKDIFLIGPKFSMVSVSLILLFIAPLTWFYYLKCQWFFIQLPVAFAFEFPG